MSKCEWNYDTLVELPDSINPYKIFRDVSERSKWPRCLENCFWKNKF